MTKLIAVGILFFQSLAYSQIQACSWPDLVKLDQGREISTYTFDYWNYVSKKFTKQFPQFLQKGQVVGDFNFNNLGIYFNSSLQKSDIALIDLDDSGKGYLLADFAKFLASVKLKNVQSTSANVLSAYIQGLESKDRFSLISSSPEKLLKYFNKDKDWFDKKQTQFIFNKIDQETNKFDLNQELEDVSLLKTNLYKLNLNITKRLSTNFSILDSGFKIHSSGSSKDLVRIWYLLRYQDLLAIAEVKEVRCPGTELLFHQLELKDRLAQSANIFDSTDFWKDSQVINLDHSYIFRYKKDNPIESIDIESLKDAEYTEYVLFYSKILGYYHSKTASPDYTQKLKATINSVSSQLIQFSKNYKDDLKKRLK